MKGISGQTRLYCLIGDPVAHSLSPWIMNRALHDLRRDEVYTAFRVSRDSLFDAVTGLVALNGIGANVTYPYKEAVMPLIDHPAAEVKLLGAANTLHFTDNGIAGYNTDAIGTTLALQHFGSCEIAGNTAVILGAGGAARAAALGLLEAGISRIIFLARNREKTVAATARLRDRFASATLEIASLIEPGDKTIRAELIADAGILINATVLGMAGVESDRSPLDADVAIHQDLCCLEMIYHPRETPFFRQCTAANARCIDGVGLLVAQAQAALRIWSGETFDLESIYNELTTRLGEMA